MENLYLKGNKNIMDVKDLRIGNKIEAIATWNDNKEHWEVAEVMSIEDGEILSTATGMDGCFQTNIRPIPLTEDCLIKFGAVLQQDKLVHEERLPGNAKCEFDGATIYEFDNFFVFVKNGKYYFIIDENCDDISDFYTYVEIDTVHYLQNIYNVLNKGKELEFKQ